MNIRNIHNCFGCGVCAVSCSKKLIEIRLNKDGFYEPYIANPYRCTDCGSCFDVCSYSHSDIALKKNFLSSYAAWSNDSSVRRKCSSGGVGYEVARFLIDQGYQVLGCRFNAEKNRAEHYVASTVEELLPSIGSKYIQSYTVDGLKMIDKKKKYLIIGMPCQIDSFRRYIKRFRCEENFVLMDFFCHGVPSKLVWDKYIKEVEGKVGKKIYVAWRYKDTGWHDSYNLFVEGEEGQIYSRKSQGDLFYKLFFSDACLGKACYEKCRFKWKHSSADIRIGDAWGKEFMNDDDGVSIAVAMTSLGNHILTKSNCNVKDYSFELIAGGQMKNNPPNNRRSLFLLFLLRTKLSLRTIYKVFFIIQKIKNKVKI